MTKSHVWALVAYAAFAACWVFLFSGPEAADEGRTSGDSRPMPIEERGLGYLGLGAYGLGSYGLGDVGL